MVSTWETGWSPPDWWHTTLLWHTWTWAGLGHIASYHHTICIFWWGLAAVLPRRPGASRRRGTATSSHHTGPGCPSPAPSSHQHTVHQTRSILNAIRTFWCHSRMILRRFVTEGTSKSRCCNVSWSPVRVWSEHSARTRHSLCQDDDTAAWAVAECKHAAQQRTGTIHCVLSHQGDLMGEVPSNIQSVMLVTAMWCWGPGDGRQLVLQKVPSKGS